MAATLQEKTDTVQGLHELFAQSQAAYLLDYKTCKCKDLTVLRRSLSEKGARFSVVKNTLAKRAIKETKAEALDGFFKGSTAVVWTSNDPVSPAKVITDFLKDRENLSVKGAVVDGKVIDSAGVQALATLPSKEELQARVLAQINAPAIQLLRTINAPAAQLVRLLEAWRKKLAETSGE